MRRALICILGLLPLAAEAGPQRLTAADIDRDIVGKRIYLAVPFGGEFPLAYYRSGRVDGSGEALGLGRFMQPKDKGRWWISGDRLCQQFTTWYDGSPMCFELYRLEERRVKWVRDNGETGTARIAGAV